MKLKSITEIKDLRCKQVLLRLDLNVPLKKNKIIDDWKIVKILPTIKYLIQKDAKIIIVSHLGRPDGKKQKNLSLLPVARHLEKLLKKKVLFLKDDIDSKSLIKKINKLTCGKIAVLENIRFYQEEEKNDKKFAKNLAELADVYINEAFAVSHRKHCSISAITKILPSCAGLFLQEEIKVLERIIKKPKHPFVVLLGGAKASTKIPIIENLLPKADKILLGGALANTFLSAKGYQTGTSLIDKKSINTAKKLLKSQKIILPKDVIVKNSKESQKISIIRIRKSKELFDDELRILDIGLLTIKEYSDFLKKARTIIWNGPMGYFEEKEFSRGTIDLARLISSPLHRKIFTVAGGGETISVIRKAKMEKNIDWISTGGGAMLAFLGGEKLPGIIPLIKNH